MPQAQLAPVFVSAVVVLGGCGRVWYDPVQPSSDAGPDSGAVDSGAVDSGAVDSGAVDAGPPITFAVVSAGFSHTCGLTSNGLIYCWGLNDSGQLGGNDGQFTGASAPVPVDMTSLGAGVSFESVDAGDRQSCGIAATGRAYCWGNNAQGQLGAGSFDPNSDSAAEVLIPSGNFTALTAGGETTCGISDDVPPVAYCWGDDSNGTVGNGEAVNGAERWPSALDVQELGPGEHFVSISAGGGFNCGITNLDLSYCWGKDSSGQLGENLDGDNADEFFPTIMDSTLLNPGTFLTSISTGTGHGCGIANDRETYCWGGDALGGLGNGGGTAQDENVPTPIDTSPLAPGDHFISLTAGFFHTCGITTMGRAYCWGSNLEGQLGNGGSGVAASPTPVDMSILAGGTFVALTAGGFHTCGLDAEGNAYCWGNNGDGQLGVGPGGNVTETRPVRVDMSAIQP